MKLAITHQTPEFYQFRLTWIQTEILMLLAKKSQESRCNPKVCGEFQGQESLSLVFTSFLNIGPCDSSGNCSGLIAPLLAENSQWVQDAWSVPGTSALIILNFLNPVHKAQPKNVWKYFSH